MKKEGEGSLEKHKVGEIEVVGENEFYRLT